jgi:flagella basal body P-ring formation protein FlgA
MRAFLSCCVFFIALTVGADVGRFLEPIQIGPNPPNLHYVVKSSALVSPLSPRPQVQKALPSQDFVVLDRTLMEARLSEALAHRFQASGKVAVFLTREWRNLRSGSNFIIKVKDCSPDELTSSTFVRFTIWDQGKEIGSFAEPVRMAHYVKVFYSKSPLHRGTRLNSSGLSSRLVDILKQHAGSVPAQSSLAGYQLSASIKANSPIKWNNLSKVTLVRKGQIVDVFASGNGIYVTMKGMALGDGVAGGIVNIKNLSSDKEFPAKVLNENSVKVHL